MKHTFIRKIANTLVCSSLLIGSAAYAEDQCSSGFPAPVSGNISNNGQAGGGFSTLGVVALKVGEKPNVLAKMKCGIVGVEAPAEAGTIAFTHTLSCDDKLEVDLGFGPQTVHSQLTLNTQGSLAAQFCNGQDPSQGIFGPFTERSVPATYYGQSTGRGMFTGVTEGEIFIEGDINCLGTIDMTFKGYVCLVPPQ